MNRPALPEKGRGIRNEVGAFICSLRSWCSRSLKGLLELARTQPQKFEMRPVWGATTLAANLPGTFVDRIALLRNPTLIPNIWHVLRFLASPQFEG